MAGPREDGGCMRVLGGPISNWAKRLVKKMRCRMVWEEVLAQAAYRLRSTPVGGGNAAKSASESNGQGYHKCCRCSSCYTSTRCCSSAQSCSSTRCYQQNSVVVTVLSPAGRLAVTNKIQLRLLCSVLQVDSLLPTKFSCGYCEAWTYLRST